MNIKNFLKRISATAFFGIASTNFGNALYAYQSGPYGQRKGFLGPDTNTFVVWSNATLSLVASIVLLGFSFKK